MIVDMANLFCRTDLNFLNAKAYPPLSFLGQPKWNEAPSTNTLVEFAVKLTDTLQKPGL